MQWIITAMSFQLRPKGTIMRQEMCLESRVAGAQTYHLIFQMKYSLEVITFLHKSLHMSVVFNSSSWSEKNLAYLR